MTHIVFHQTQVEYMPVMEKYSVTKENWIDYALGRGVSCDMLKMLEDLPSEAFYTRESGEMHLMITET